MAKATKAVSVDEETIVTPPIEIEIPDSEEVAFLKRILRIQNDGKFGTHLNEEIIGRIAYLQSK